ncbi:diaminopimelate epimerase [Selenomonas sp.]|uniref:diaminopimelate epimerase n=1 Tax=Selenomonas sp. TaxID=2053611 RepID=UPI002A7F2834|nr:diaminopimelate epimerase [Selenomonas sp.]MDY4416025.1 diaminopimelate epimerase [Selenomonas sp.]
MMMIKNYTTAEKEYMVLNGSTMRDMPGAAAIRLLADRHQGVGADRVLVFTGTHEEPSFLVYEADGTQANAAPMDYKILVRYLAEEGIAANPAELAKVFGDQAFVEAFSTPSVTRLEFHVTDAFVARMKDADAKAERMAC